MTNSISLQTSGLEKIRGLRRVKKFEKTCSVKKLGSNAYSRKYEITIMVKTQKEARQVLEKIK